MAEPIYSPDGNFIWDGSEWVPVSSESKQTVDMQDSVIGGDVVSNTNIQSSDAEVIKAAMEGVVASIREMNQPQIRTGAPQEDPEELIEQPVVETQPEPTAALPAGQPPTSISANPLAMDDNTTIVGKNIFQKPAIYAITFFFLLVFAIFALSEATANERESYDYELLLDGWNTPTECDNLEKYNGTGEEQKCQHWQEQIEYYDEKADIWFIFSYFSLTLSLMSLGYGGYLHYNSRKNK